VAQILQFKKAARRPTVPGSGNVVASSVIRSIGYDEATRGLDVTLVSGKTYRYFDVPLEIYARFLDAASKGEFFNLNVKNAFVFKEVN
jgi:hypothetical protein